MQLGYSLVERSIEGEHIPAARECGLGVCPWSPLAGGFLTGKYSRDDRHEDRGRLSGSNPFQGEFTKFTDRNWRILDGLKTVAAQAERPLAQVALAWTLAQPGITAAILGASKLEHLQDNLSALEIEFTAEQMQRLDRASKRDRSFPDGMFGDDLKRAIFDGTAVRSGWTINVDQIFR